MRGVLRKWTPREKYFKYQNFLIRFHLSLFLECLDAILRKSEKSIYPINSFEVIVFLPRLNKIF